MQNLLFYLGFTTLITHELDAVAQSEWRLLFFLRQIPDSAASAIFIALHVPLLTFILWLTTHENDVARQRSQLALSSFLVIHAGLHKHLEHHLDYSFTSPLSLSLIYGGGLLGLAYMGTAVLSGKESANDSQN